MHYITATPYGEGSQPELLATPAEPDFPKTIFVEFQTNIMSADGTGKMATHRPKKIPHKRKNLHSTKSL